MLLRIAHTLASVMKHSSCIQSINLKSTTCSKCNLHPLVDEQHGPRHTTVPLHVLTCHCNHATKQAKPI